MHDTLGYIAHEPVHRQYHHNELTFSMMYAYTENFVLPISHDEVVHGKGSLLNKIPGDRWQQLATLRALYAYMWAHPGKQLLFMGGEFGAGRRVGRVALAGLVAARRPGPPRRLPADHRPEPALPRHPRAVVALDTVPDGFHWIDANDAAGQRLLVPALRQRRVGAGVHRELLRRPARGLPARPAVRRPVGRGAQHRRGRVLRLRRRQLRRRSRRRRSRGTANRRRPGCACRRSASCGCGIRAGRPLRDFVPSRSVTRVLGPAPEVSLVRRTCTV